MMFVLVTLFGLVAYPAMAAAPVEKGGKELPTGQKQSQEKPVATQPQEGSMAVVPAGEFIMGSPTGDSDEQPAHKVYVDAFSMDKYEVTVGQYAAFLQAKGIDPPSDWKTMNRSEHQKRPVANVDWADAFAFCKWAGKRLMTVSIHGATRLRRRFTRTLGNRTGAITEYWRRLGRLKPVRAPMASMIWPEMSGNGSAIGMTITTIRTARRKTRQDRHRAGRR
jgi:Sulfatase-modifying factor enzyme 1